jgi:AraC-like DNA-binding protein
MGEQIAQHVVGVPAPPLRAFVYRYTGYRYEGFEPGVHVGLPSRHLTFLVSLGDPIDVGLFHDQTVPRERFAALVGGLHTQPAAVHHDGNQYGIQLDVTPLGARALFGMPASEIATLTLPLDTVLGHRAGELMDRLRSASVWSRRFAVLDQILLHTLSELDEPPHEVTFAWDRLTRSGGMVGVRRLAMEVGWSRRHLSEQFRREFGLAPKTMGRVVRFDRARRMLMRLERPSLGTVAATAGYADQAHMTRDWREFAGASPMAWMAAEQLPFFQDDMDELAPDSQP